MALSQGASDSGGPSFDPWEALDGLPAMVAVATASGALVFVNKRVESFTGRSRQELVESGWVRVVHPSDLSRAIGNLGQILDSREPAHAELRLRRADGAFVWHNVCVEAFPSEAQEPQLVKAVAVDCQRLHEELDSLRAARQQAAELSGLRFLALQDVSTPLLLEMAVQALATGLSATLVVALRSDGDGGSAVLESAFGAPPEFQRSARVELARDGHFAFCLAQPPREVVAVYDLERDFRFAPDRILAQHKAKSGLTIVVQTAEGPWGLLGVFSQARRPFSESDAKFLIAVADTLSCALDRERRLSHLAGTA
ncbi:MAG TPA: PAS domain-containing protein, partial [Dehalococcoidia bacterium]|nr:PAS domain-containing protein [Dehalococcoidia bacterium]